MISAQLMTILSDNANAYIKEIQGRLDATGTTATGESGKSLRYEITEEGNKIVLQILAKPYFAVVETGRKPSPDKKPSRAMIENITKWVEVRGKEESMIWAIAVNIQKKGTQLFRKGGRTDIYTDTNESFAEKMFMEVVKDISSEYFRQAQVTFIPNNINKLER